MYSDKANINILTSLLVAHGIRHAVVCPGSRNAPIVHNLCECPDIQCESVTDERSATFIALGMSQALDEPVVVCVTSGSALLNTLPGVSEAFYQHRQIIVISADRPAAMIDQLQGQTLPQLDALGRFVVKAVSLPEPHDDTGKWYCNRLVNEALIAMRQHGGGPVHINVPITEPLFNFTTPSLPKERIVKYTPRTMDFKSLESLAWDFFYAKKPMIVIGQLPYSVVSEEREELSRLRDTFVILQEKLSDDTNTPCHFDEALTAIGNNNDYNPDFVLYIGDTFVSKRIKRYLQGFSPTPLRTIVVSDSGRLTDVTMHATDLVECSPKDIIEALAKVNGLCHNKPAPDYFARWKSLLSKWKDNCDKFQPAYSQMLAVKLLHEKVNKQNCWLQYANSTAVRLGQLYSTHYMFVNRGVNGIEGSLSTAVGFASKKDKPVYCVIGDLSFFYDQNALWNNVDKTRLRIFLLNNDGGGIFHQLPGLERSDYRDKYISAGHHTTAKGICEETHVKYMTASDSEQLTKGMEWLTDSSDAGPKLLEVFTDAETDAHEFKRITEITIK